LEGKKGQVGKYMEQDYRHKKGIEGENYITDELSKLGFEIIYVGDVVKHTIDGPKFFCVDLLVYGKGRCFWVQCKNKEPRKAYPDTGLELWRFQGLKKLQQKSNIPVLLLFTDSSQRIYGDWIDDSKETDNHGNTFNLAENCEMIYFWLSDLKELYQLLP